MVGLVRHSSYFFLVAGFFVVVFFCGCKFFITESLIGVGEKVFGNVAILRPPVNIGDELTSGFL